MNIYRKEMMQNEKKDVKRCSGGMFLQKCVKVRSWQEKVRQQKFRLERSVEENEKKTGSMLDDSVNWKFGIGYRGRFGSNS